jgi:drug/metabolite transporter, DME family
MSAPSSLRLRGLAFIALAAVSWGTTGAVSATLLARAGTTPVVVGAARVAVAAVLLLAAARAWRGLRLARGDAWRCVALGVCMAAFQLTYFNAVARAGIALTALLAICSAPIMIALLAAALLGERAGPRVAVALGCGVVGTALLVGAPGSDAETSRAASGIVLALGAGLSYALYVVIAKRAVATTPPLSIAAGTFAVAAILLVPAFAIEGAPRQIVLGWSGLLYLGAVATAGAYALYTSGLRSVSATAAGVASLLEPLTATLLGVLVFGERLGVAGTVGAVLLLGALATVVAAPER